MKIVNISYLNGESSRLDNVTSLNYDQATNCWFFKITSGSLVMIGRELIRLMHMTEVVEPVNEEIEENTTNNEDI